MATRWCPLADLPLLGNVPAAATAVPGGLTAISALAATVLAVSVAVSGAHAADPVDAARVAVVQEVPAADTDRDEAPSAVVTLSGVPAASNTASSTTTSEPSSTTTTPVASAADPAPPVRAPAVQEPPSAPPTTVPSPPPAAEPAPPAAAPPPAVATTVPAASTLQVRPDGVAVEDNKDETIDVLSNDSRSNGAIDENTLTIVVPPAHARDYRVHDDHIHYRSENHYSGTDHITYRVCDTTGACATTTVTIVVSND